MSNYPDSSRHSYLPKVYLSDSSLEFKATRLGEVLKQTIKIRNSTPQTVLKGFWVVAPHAYDPPNTPETHAWISFDPAKFKGNSVECSIMVDTHQLMPDKVYERQLFLHTNSSTETQIVNIKVQTASLPNEARKVPYGYLSVVFVLSAIASFFAAAFVMAAKPEVGERVGLAASANAAIVGFFAVSVAIIGLVAEKAGSKYATIVALVLTPIAVLLAYQPNATSLIFLLVFLLVVSTTIAVNIIFSLRKIRVIFMTLLPLVALAATIGALIAVKVAIWGKVGAASGSAVTGMFIQLFIYVVVVNRDVNFLQRRFSREFTIIILLLTTALGVCLGMGFQFGFINFFFIIAISGTSLTLAGAILYSYLNPAKVMAKSTNSERNLIQP